MASKESFEITVSKELCDTLAACEWFLSLTCRSLAQLPDGKWRACAGYRADCAVGDTRVEAIFNLWEEVRSGRDE